MSPKHELTLFLNSKNDVLQESTIIFLDQVVHHTNSNTEHLKSEGD